MSDFTSSRNVLDEANCLIGKAFDEAVESNERKSLDLAAAAAGPIAEEAFRAGELAARETFEDTLESLADMFEEKGGDSEDSVWHEAADAVRGMALAMHSRRTGSPLGLQVTDEMQEELVRRLMNLDATIEENLTDEEKDAYEANQKSIVDARRSAIMIEGEIILACTDQVASTSAVLPQVNVPADLDPICRAIWEQDEELSKEGTWEEFKREWPADVSRLVRQAEAVRKVECDAARGQEKS